MTAIRNCPRVQRVQRLIRLLGGPAHVRIRLAKAVQEISVKAIHQWVHRGTIPPRRLIELNQLAREDGWLLDVDMLLDNSREVSPDEPLVRPIAAPPSYLE